MGEPSMGNAERFRGDSTEVCTSSSPWFSSEDIPADSWDGIVVQIEDVLVRKGVKFNKGKSRPRELCLKFAGIDKELVVNVTNRRIIDGMFSPATERWVGKWVTLYVQKGITTGDGSTKNGIRFRDDGPKGARPPVQHAPPPVAPKPPPAQPAATTAPATNAPGAPAAPDAVWNRDRVLAYLTDSRNRAATKAEAARLGKSIATSADLKALDDDTLAVLETRVFDAMTPFDERTPEEPRP